MSETNARVGVTIGTKAETAPVDRYTASVQRMHAAIKDLFASKNVATFGAAFSAGALSLQSMVGKISEAISGSSDLASEMAQVERRVGLTGEAFQVLGRAGKATSEELIASLAKYRVKLGEALAGDKGARELFAGLGMSPETLTRLPMERQLETVGAAIGKFSDRNRQAAEAQAIFGKGYTSMIPLLEKLRVEGYDKLREKVSETAGVLDNDMSKALGKAKRETSEASNQMSIALAATNLRLLKMKAAITESLANNAGTIQSVGTGLAGGFLAASVLTQLSTRIGPQLNVIGSQGAAAFSKGFGVGAALLPGIVAERFAGAGAAGSFAAMGRALATPFGAALAVAAGAILINELERAALEAIARADAASAAKFDRYRTLQTSITSAASLDDVANVQADAAKFLSERNDELEKMQRTREALATMPLAPGMTRPNAPAGEQEKMDALRSEVELAQRLVAFSIAQGVAIAEKNRKQRESTDQTFAENAELEKTRAKREGLMEREKQNRFDALTDDNSKLEFLHKWRGEEDAAFNAKINATKNAELAADHELEKRVKLADIDAKIAQIRHHAAEEAQRNAEDAEREVEKMLEKLDRERRHEILRGMDAEMQAAALTRAQTDGDFTKTSVARWDARVNEIQTRFRAVSAALDEIEARKKTAAAMGLSTDQHDGEIQRLKDEQNQLQIDFIQKGPNPTSWVEQTAAALTQLRDQWGTTAQQIADTISGTIGSAVDSVASNITQAMLVTGDWAAAFSNVGMTIATQLVQAIISMGARWVATQIMMAVAGKTLAAASVTANVPIAAAQSAVWAAPATLATIASFGGAAAAAPFEIAGSIGLTQLLTAVPGFSEGGYTGESGGVVHPKEYVFSAPAVDALGLDNLETMHRAALNPSTPGATSTTTGTRAKGVQIVTVIDDGSAHAAAEIDKLMSNPRTENHLVRIARARRAEIGIAL